MTDATDPLGGAASRRFLRFVYEFEVEVTDPVQAASYTMDWGRDDSGQTGMVPYTNENEQVAAAVQQALTEGLVEVGPRAGFRWHGGSMLPRPIADDGQHAELTLPRMPARLENGELDRGNLSD